MKETIKELIVLLDQNNLNEIQFEDKNVKIKVRRDNVNITTTSNIVEQFNEVAPAVEAVEYVKGYQVCSPITGTYYAKPSPDEAEFIKVGDVVEKGQQLAIIESMKVLNGIHAPVAGKIVSINVNNESPVEKDQLIITIEE
jgi:acetyl-CoA carboxylase biotin carboxyl carrier protein